MERGPGVIPVHVRRIEQFMITGGLTVLCFPCRCFSVFLLLQVCRAQNLTTAALQLLQEATDPMMQVQAAMSDVLHRAYLLWLSGSHGATAASSAAAAAAAPAGSKRRLLGHPGPGSDESDGYQGVGGGGGPGVEGWAGMGPNGVPTAHGSSAAAAAAAAAVAAASSGEGGGQAAMRRARGRVLLQQEQQAVSKPSDTTFVFDAAWGVLQNWTQSVTFDSDVVDQAQAPLSLPVDTLDSKRFFNALWQARIVLKNQAAQPILTDTITKYWRQAYEEALVVLLESVNATSASVAQRLQRRLEAVLALESGGGTGIKAVLHSAVAYNISSGGWPPGNPGTPAAQHAQSSSVNLSTAIAAPVVAATAILVIAMITLWCVRRSQHRTLRGSVVPPGAGPSTTLVVTDIQVCARGCV